ncbi:MAG: PIG-L deacetylase family protein [Candidatus Acidiferrales bacterium]
MLRLTLGELREPPRRILCLGAHCDDIEIGCGGTILRLLQEDSEREIWWQVFSSSSVRKREASKCARLFLEGAKSKKVAIRNYEDRFFPTFQQQIKMEFEKMKKEFVPDLILTHYRHDLHQDHRIICELTWNTFRDHLILEYEIPKYDGDLGQPNFFVPLEQKIYQKKVHYILDAFESQRTKRWFDKETFLALMRLRGVECAAPTRFAEAFHCRKLVL